MGHKKPLKENVFSLAYEFSCFLKYHFYYHHRTIACQRPSRWRMTTSAISPPTQRRMPRGALA